MDDSPPWDEERTSQVRLALIAGVGPRTRQALLARFGSARDVLSAASAELQQTPGVGARLAGRIVDAGRDPGLGPLPEQCHRHGVRIVLPDDAEYPGMLRHIHDPPGVLFVRGCWSDGDRLALGVVGSRRASHYGRNQAHRFGYALAKAGLTVVSGLARGVDEAAHRGALDAGGRTVAVLAGGVLNVYPPEHVALANRIAEAGVVLSEAPPFREPYSGSFPQRNRLITGLSLGLLVVEAASRSGALISARHAMEQNRDVFAVPGRIDTPHARGCHQLLRDGAVLVESVDDILEQLSHLPDAVAQQPANTGEIRHPAELRLNPIEKQVLAGLQHEPRAIDELIRLTGLPTSQVLAAISGLELRRLIRRLGGQQVVRI